MDARRSHSGPGKTAPRLINDLLDYDPRYSRNGRNLLADPAPRYRQIALPPRRGRSDCHHALMKKEHQSNAPRSNDEQPDEFTEYKVATYCHHCLYHFDVTANFSRRQSRKTPCSLADDHNPLHHLRLTDSKSSREHRETQGLNKYDQFTEGHRFACSAVDCPLVVDIKISPPRLSQSLLSYILNPAKLEARGRREVEKEPERYQDIPLTKPLQALGYLRQYLSDAKAARNREGLRKIARRNKKYMLTFADECDELFHYLDFVPVEETSPETEEVNSFWQLPIITDLNRNFIDDVVHEIDLLMVQRPLDEGARALVQHIPALKDIERSLGCFDYPKRNRTVDLSTDEHPCYISLGAVDNFTDTFLAWAYDRQCECDPSSKPYYLDCLEDLARGRGSADLQTKVVMATSAGELGQKVIEDSYQYFNLDPDSVEGDDHIMGLYKSRIESAPRQKEEARECLRIIAKHRSSEKIEALANDKTMSLDEALEFLCVSSDTAADSIEASAVALSLDSSDKAKIARALRVIANHRSNDFTLQRAAAAMESGTGGSTLDVGDAYNRLQITTRNAPDETVLTYFQSLSNGAPSGSKDSYTEALRVIALDRGSNFLLRKLEDPNADVQAGTAEPVGLDNIGNTCYLNSLLQYYYTIKPVRDMVINFQQHRMSLNEEDIRKKRVGGRIVDKSEIIKAQKFVDELHNLFENLKTASSRSIKPTRELAELTIFSSAAVADFRRSSISSPHGPPNLSSILDGPVYGPHWPPPPPPPLPITLEEDIEMVDHPSNKNMDNGDDSSEATLVDLEQLPPSYSDSVANEEASPGADAVMVNGGESISDKPSAPEKPPPIPPRNKSGLVIQTNENKDLLPNDELWKFGSQQDVTEVIGNVMFRLQCAIKPTSIEETSGAQIDIIRDTFFGANTVYTQKAQSLERKTEAWPSIIVFPGKVGRDIYEALDVVYDEQQVEIDNTTVPQYASLSKLPPILQIHIQRTDFDHETHRAFKNRNPVVFPETIYLDRYVDTGDPDSPIMRRRREAWVWKERLRILEARHAALSNEQAQISVPDALLATKDFVSTLQEAEIEGLEIDPALPEALEDRIAELAAELEAITTRIATLKQKIQGQFVDMREYEYKLQSVFIHRGEAGGGHYWIYIYDFEHDIWREYNDEWVSEVKDRRTIFEHQGGAGGTPYYLVYVKSSNIKELVDAVCRDVQEVEVTDLTDEWPDVMENGVSSTLNEDEDTPDTRHVEHAKPRPLRPKPAVLEPTSAWDDAWAQNSDRGLDANGRQW